MVKVKRVSLNNSSRKGYYWRITQSGLTRYYKYKKGFSKIDAVDKGLDSVRRSTDKRKKPDKIRRKIKRKSATVHFRVDYSPGTKNHTRMELNDTFVEIPDVTFMTEEEILKEAEKRLSQFWITEVGHSSAGRIIQGIEESELIQGIEEGVGRDYIQARTKYGTYRARYKSVQAEMEEFREKLREDQKYLSQYR